MFSLIVSTLVMLVLAAVVIMIVSKLGLGLEVAKSEAKRS